MSLEIEGGRRQDVVVYWSCGEEFIYRSDSSDGIYKLTT